MKRGQPLLWGALAVLLLPGLAGAQSVEALNRQLTDVEGRLREITRDPLTQTNVRSPTFVEERLTDGELFYRLQDYLRASIIFTDIVDNYANHRAYPDALFLLGDSLFHAGDYLGARSRFRMVLDRASDSAFRPYVQRALGRLIEIAIHIRDFDGVEGYFQALSRLPPTEVEATTAYFRAKYLYSRAVPLEEDLVGTEDGATPQIDTAMVEQSRTAFEAVPQGSPYYPQARYFIGTIHTLRGEYPQAIEAFRRVLSVESSSPEQQTVIELTQLALGRLYYETDQLDQAIEAYQGVSRTSATFHIALYEIAWVYIRLGDSTRAERALEVLSVAAPDSPHIPDGKVLRGNLLLRNGRFDDANDVFRQVRAEFGPVFRGLEDIRENHQDLPAYFQELVRDNMESFDVNHFLPESARRWVDMEGGDFERALSVLSDLSQARHLVRETVDLIDRLNAAINAPNRVSIFADLRRHREGTTALRNRLARVRRRLIRMDESSGGGGELATVREERRRIERSLGRMPTSEDDFISRDDQLLGRYRRLQRDLSELEVELMGIDARIVATEQFLQQTEDEQQNPEAVRNEIGQHQQAVVTYREEIHQIRRLIEIARIQVGVGDNRYQRDERLRNEYRRLVDRERQLGGGNSRTDPLYRRILAIESQIDAHDEQIDRVVEERVSDMRRVISEEQGHIDGYRQALTNLEGETEEVVGAVTYTAFIDVRDRFYDLVLRADVGRVDVAWARREEHRMRVDMLTRDRSREMQALDDEFRDIMDESRPGDEEEEESTQ